MNNYFFENLHLCKRKNQFERAMTLTHREHEILGLIAKELTTEQIANYLNISVPTVESHRRNMFKKLGVQSVVGLVKEALRNGWIKI